MSSTYPSGRIFQHAVCGITVVAWGAIIYEWDSGAIHDCSRRLDGYLEDYTECALDGDPDALRLFPDVVSSWMLAQR